MASEDPYMFLFEFDVLCGSYYYVTNAYRLNLFPATLKNATFCWFMGLDGNNIGTWA
jgi:hypothetical protein